MKKIITLRPSNKRAKFLKILEGKPIIREIVLFARKINKINEQHVLISHKYKAIYFPINKVANTSLKESLGKDFKIIKINNLKKINLKGYFKFTFVRNPYDRIVSCYTDKIKWPAESDVIASRPMKLWEDMTFKEFVRAVKTISDESADFHFRSQHRFTRRYKMNFIGRFENLKKDYLKICGEIGIKTSQKLPHRRKSSRKKDYREYYDEETKKLVQERYKKDIELFGYSF